MQYLYTDGGVIKKNPSVIGGTWAYCVVDGNDRIEENYGHVTPEWAGMPNITNNLTELIALVLGLLTRPKGWYGMVYSDSKITLGRVFSDWGLEGIPQWLRNDLKDAINHVDIEYCMAILLQGHPTKAELEKGMGKSGRPVSEHNVWCDAACTKAGLAYQAELLNNIIGGK